MAINDDIAEKIQQVLELWDVSYDSEDEKYIAKSTEFVVLNPEQIEWIRQFGLHIFSVQRFDETLTVKFSPGGWQR